MKKLKRASNSAEVEFVIGSLIAALGGVEGLVQASLEHFNKAPPGRRADFYLAMIRSIQMCQPVEQDPDELSDEELESGLAESILGMVEDQPELVADAMRRAGWTCSPPAQ